MGGAEVFERSGGAVVIGAEGIARVGVGTALAAKIATAFLISTRTGGSDIVRGREVLIGAVVDPHSGIDGQGLADLVSRPPCKIRNGEEKED